MEEKDYTGLAVKLQEVDSRSKANEHRISDLETGMDKMQGTQVVLVQLANGIDKVATQMVDIKSDMKEVKQSQNALTEKVSEIENRPANETKKSVDDIKGKLIWLLVGGVVVGLLSQILPNIPW